MAAPSRVGASRVRAPRKRVWAASIGLVAAVLISLPVGPIASTPTIPGDPVPRGASASPGLPFQMPSIAALRRSPRKVFAHYIPSLTVSLDNKDPATDYYAREYLTPQGEQGKHEAYGGFLRDRPLPRPVRSDPNWQVADFRDEVQQAISVGIDGFSLDLLQLPGGTDRRVSDNVPRLLQAAHDVDPGFSVMLMPDVSGSLADASVEQLADYVAQLGRAPSAYRLSDGRLVVAPFHAESHPASWWQSFLTVMRTRHHEQVAFLPVFLDERGLVPSYARFSVGLSNWGARNPDENDSASTLPESPRGRIATVHDAGAQWMQPVSMQDERPRAGSFQEAVDTTNLRNSWRIAIDGGADLVQMVTWNDYAEGSQLAPSVASGWSFLDISAYYLVWFKTGTPPPITRDVVFLTHRTQRVGAAPRYPETVLMQPVGPTQPVDQVEALAFLRAPAVVRVSVNGSSTSCALPAGVGTCTAALQPGAVRADVHRSGFLVALVVSPHRVLAQPPVQDLAYVTSSSSGGQPRVPVRRVVGRPAPAPSAS